MNSYSGKILCERAWVPNHFVPLLNTNLADAEPNPIDTTPERVVTPESITEPERVITPEEWNGMELSLFNDDTCPSGHISRPTHFWIFSAIHLSSSIMW